MPRPDATATSREQPAPSRACVSSVRAHTRNLIVSACVALLMHFGPAETRNRRVGSLGEKLSAQIGIILACRPETFILSLCPAPWMFTGDSEKFRSGSAATNNLTPHSIHLIICAESWHFFRGGSKFRSSGSDTPWTAFGTAAQTREAHGYLPTDESPSVIQG